MGTSELESTSIIHLYYSCLDPKAPAPSVLRHPPQTDWEVTRIFGIADSIKSGTEARQAELKNYILGVAKRKQLPDSMTSSIAHVGLVPQMMQQPLRTANRRAFAAPHIRRDGVPKLIRRFTPNTSSRNARAFIVTGKCAQNVCGFVVYRLSPGRTALVVQAATLQQPQTEQTSIRLSQSHLQAISATEKAAVPTFPRKLTPKHNVMIHLGVGGFFRSHQALYLNQLMEQGHDDWAFVGMGLMDFDFPMYDALKSQDYLYTVASKVLPCAGSLGLLLAYPPIHLAPRACQPNRCALPSVLAGENDPEYTVVGSVLDFVYAPDDKHAAIERMADLQTKMVTLTITEKGYCVNSDGDLDLTNRYIIEDLKDITNPSSAMGFIVAAVRTQPPPSNPSSFKPPRSPRSPIDPMICLASICSLESHHWAPPSSSTLFHPRPFG
eukprot:1182677-Prorocentrum_minimum.AAC.1